MRKSTLFLLIIFIFTIFAYFHQQQANIATPKPAKPQVHIYKDALSGKDYITTNNYANLKLEYYYYISGNVVKHKILRPPYLIMVTGLSGSGEAFVSQDFIDFAEQEGFVIIAPTFIFDDKNWDNETSYQFPEVWSGSAMNDIINSFDKKHNILPAGLYMLGFSAGAQFVSRYSLLFPDYVKACAVNSAGGIDEPQKYQDTKFYVAIGLHDEDFRIEIAHIFYSSASKQGIDVTYKEYPIEHDFSPDEIKDELAFFHRVKNNGRK